MKTGLALAGGGSRGSYQIGVWRALKKLGISPDVITGTSVGALNGALMVQDSYDTAVELWENLNTTSVFDFPKEPNFLEYAKAFLKDGGACRRGLETLIKTHLNEEKIRASRISLGMVLARRDDLSSHQVFTEDVPKGMLSDYLMATTACFPAAKCHTISGVQYMDGGYCDNLPVGLAKSKGVTQVIAVSLDQHNPKRPPFAKDSSVIAVCPKWDLGNWLVFHKENTGRNIRLGYLDTLKAFGIYEGDAFTFQNNTFEELLKRRQIALSHWHRFLKANALLPSGSAIEILKEAAEITGKLLKLSPFCVYTADSFLKAMKRKQSCPKSLKSPSPFVLAKLFLEKPCRVLEFQAKYPKETAAGIFLSVFQ